MLTGPARCRYCSMAARWIARSRGTPHNITWNNHPRHGPVETRSVAGTLTLNAANTYSGNTVINAGTLVLGASGSIASSATINVEAALSLMSLPCRVTRCHQPGH